jgi:hypothetical protein
MILSVEKKEENSKMTPPPTCIVRHMMTLIKEGVDPKWYDIHTIHNSIIAFSRHMRVTGFFKEGHWLSDLSEVNTINCLLWSSLGAPLQSPVVTHKIQCKTLNYVGENENENYY